VGVGRHLARTLDDRSVERSARLARGIPRLDIRELEYRLPLRGARTPQALDEQCRSNSSCARILPSPHADPVIVC